MFFRGIIPLFPIKNSNFATITTNYLKYGGFELHNYKGKKRARKGQEKLLALIKANPYISVSSIAKECDLSVKTIRNLIDELREDHLLERVGPDKGGYWKVLDN